MRALRVLGRWVVLAAHLVALVFSAQTYAQPSTQLEALQLIDSNTNHSRAAIWRVMTELVGTTQTEIGWNSYYAFGATYTQSGVGLLATLARSSERQDISDNVKNTVWKNLDLARVGVENIDAGINGVAGVRAKLDTTNSALSTLTATASSIASTVSGMASTLAGMSVNVASIAGTVNVQLPEMVLLLTKIDDILEGSGLIDSKLQNVLEFAQRGAEAAETIRDEFMDWRGAPEVGYYTWQMFGESWTAFDSFLRDKFTEASGTATAPTSFGVGLGVPVTTGPQVAASTTRDGLDVGINVVEAPDPEGTLGTTAPVWTFTVPFASIAAPFGVSLNNVTLTADFAQIPPVVRTAIHAFILCFVTIWAMGYVWEELRRYG